MPTFKTRNQHFILDNEPIQIISGAIHYFRIVPQYWEDRLLKLKACGFNTVETYVPWNLHEPREGEYNFEGIPNVTEFIQTAQKLDLMVFVRPSPYICAEWEFGGLPSWLLKDANIKLRCYYEPYLEKIRAYYNVLLPKLKPFLCTENGPIIAMQIENEYGSFGNDTRYLEYIKDLFVEHGIDVLLFTSDGPADHMLQGGMVPGILETVNFGSAAKEAFNSLRRYQPDEPIMCMEFWNGWFDHWMEEHHVRDPEDVGRVFEEMLGMGASVNVYMFHGGTNFGFYNGANHIKRYEPTVTSYDYDAPLNEYGEPTKKYFLMREILTKHTGKAPLDLPKPIERKSFGTIEMTKSINLFDSLHQLSEPITSVFPKTMEELGQDYGFILYETMISGPRPKQQLFIREIHDGALIFLDNQFLGTYERWENKQPLTLEIPKEGAKLSILVENMGRINYGPLLKDHKGIIEGVHLDNQLLFNWTMYPLRLDNVNQLHFAKNPSIEYGPTFFKGELIIDKPADTIVHLDGWAKGNLFINGFNLGRYWEVGPQKTLYLPGPLLKSGMNEIILFELHGTKNKKIHFECN
ncbi:glycoside hydrolase family 35 protein [Mesobacillus foraminis]|uniref:beta-galactosidase n=1 Tax=Mesobacillus foraminis TaxID=279826 RepID=A0A4R2BJX0_9BACI|nr:beta-galactosidase family protein [Mesobacillus foraminis]TCN27497.1 beta-galactosidase [Mesobacillus foraminis]